MPEPRSVATWLDVVKRGYGRRYAKYFDEMGIEDEEDVRRMKNARVDELRVLLSAADVKAVQLDYLADAIDACRENRRFSRGSPVSPDVLRPKSAKEREASPTLWRPDTSAGRALRSRRPQSAAPSRKKTASAQLDYRVQHKLVKVDRPMSAPAQSPSNGKALIMPQPPAYWADPGDGELPTRIMSRRRRRPKSSGGFPVRAAPGYESEKRRAQTEELGRRRRLANLGSWEEERDPRAEVPEKTCLVKRDPESGIWQLHIDPKRQLIYDRIKKPVRLDGNHRAALEDREKFRKEQAQRYKHRVKVEKDGQGLWAMDLADNAGRQETWQRVAQPFRLKGTHVHALATAQAEESERRKNTKKFYYDSAQGRKWCDRVSQPLRAAPKFKG